MGTVELTVEQLTFQADCLPLNKELINPMDNVVEANTDFKNNHITFQPASSFETFDFHDNTVHGSSKERQPFGIAYQEYNSNVYSEEYLELNRICNNGNLPEVHEKLPLSKNNNRKQNIVKCEKCDEENDDEKANQSKPSKVSDTVYPGIPAEVAQYIFQVNPNIVKTMEAALQTNSINNGSQQESSNVGKSSLLHLASTSEALALQESVIGNKNIVPASPEIVAQIVSSVHKKSFTLGNPCNLTTEVLVQQPPGSFVTSTQQNEGTHNSDISSATVKSVAVDTNGNTDPLKMEKTRELHRFPANRISTVTEKKSWFSGSSQDENVNSERTSKSVVHPTPITKSRKHQNTHRSSVCSQKGSYRETEKNEMKSINLIQNSDCKSIICDVPDGHSVSLNPETELLFALKSTTYKTDNKSELESNQSDRFELDSNYSERFETQSNFSEMSSISGIEEEMFRIRKLLLDVPTLPDDHPDFKRHSVVLGRSAGVIVSDLTNNSRAVVDQDVYFELQRQKANLDGQLESLQIELQEAMKERSTLQNNLSSVQAQLKLQQTTAEMAEINRNKLVGKCEAYKNATKQAEAAIMHLQTLLESKMTEILHLKDELKETDESNAKLRIDFEDIKVDLESKDGANQGLKSKIAELHVEVHTMAQANIQLENTCKCLKSEIEALQKSKEWYQEQLHNAQKGRTKIQQEFIALQSQCVSQNNVVEKLKSENIQLHQQLLEVQQKAVKEKEVLMRHLETIEADMMEREATFEQIQRDKGVAEEMLTARMKKIEDEKSKMTSFVFKLTDMEHQLESAQCDIVSKAETISILEKDYAEVMKKLTTSQKELNERALEIQQWQEKYNNLDHKFKEAQLEISHLNSHLLKLKEEKVAVEIALESASKEKREVNEALEGLRDNLNKLEGSFRKMKNDLASKTALLEQLQRDKQKLEEDLQLSQSHEHIAFANYNDFNMKVQANEKLVENLSKQKEQIEDELAVARNELQQTYMNHAAAVEQIKCLENEISNLKENLNRSSSSLKQVLEEKLELEQKLSYLETDHKTSALTKEDVMKMLGQELITVKEQLSHSEVQLKKAGDEKQHLTEKLSQLQVAIQDIVNNKSTSGNEEYEMSALSSNLAIIKNEEENLTEGEIPSIILDVKKVKEALENKLMDVKHQLAESELAMASHLSEKNKFEQKICMLQTENERLLKIIKKSNENQAYNSEEAPSLETQIKTQLEVYRKKVEELEQVLGVSNASQTISVHSVNEKKIDIDTQTDNVSFMYHVIEEDQKNKLGIEEVAQLEATLAKLNIEHAEQQRIYKSNIKVLTRKLKENMKARKKAEKSLELLQGTECKGFTDDKNKESSTGEEYNSSIPEGYCDTAKKNKVTQKLLLETEKELRFYKAKAEELEIKSSELQVMYDEVKRKAEANEKLALDLEKEKGRLSGVTQSNVVLKEHTSQLEAALAEKESAVSELDLATKNLNSRQQEQENQALERISELEKSLNAEQETMKQLRKQIFQAKHESSSLRKQVSSIQCGLDSANQLVDSKKQEIQTMRAEMEQQSASLGRCRLEMDAAHSENQRLASELNQLQQIVEENKAKDPLLADQIKTLSWHLRQKNQEIAALTEQLKLVEQRQLIELQGLQRSLLASKEEHELTKNELAETMKDKFSYQNKLTELGNIIKSTLEQNKMLRSKLAVHSTSESTLRDSLLEFAIPESPAPYDNSFINSLLQQSAVMPQSRPLSNLQACLNTLKQEMEVLQKQLSEHHTESHLSTVL